MYLEEDVIFLTIKKKFTFGKSGNRQHLDTLYCSKTVFFSVFFIMINYLCTTEIQFYDVTDKQENYDSFYLRKAQH